MNNVLSCIDNDNYYEYKIKKNDTKISNFLTKEYAYNCKYATLIGDNAFNLRKKVIEELKKINESDTINLENLLRIVMENGSRSSEEIHSLICIFFANYSLEQHFTLPAENLSDLIQLLGRNLNKEAEEEQSKLSSPANINAFALDYLFLKLEDNKIVSDEDARMKYLYEQDEKEVKVPLGPVLVKFEEKRIS